ncbi:MAG: ABC transporter ATP-binding protein [Candidatus Saccharimonas sp.]
MSDNIAIHVDQISKNFKLPHEKVDSIKSLFVNPFRIRDSVKVETQHALKDISFSINKGEFFGIVGRNGSGKSTLLKIIAGIYQPTKGNVKVNGRLVPFIELGVGFNPDLTGRENVYLNGALMGFSTREVELRYEAIVKFAELERFMDQKLKNYSSGMQVRLAFSVATILAESDILLIDEVLAVGDADFQRKCFEYFKHLKREGKTVIFVTHDMGAVIEYCDRAILINESKLIKSGSSEKIAVEYKKLFQPEEEESLLPQDRWGDDAISIIDPKLSKKILTDKDKSIELSYVVKANRVNESVITGFSVDGPDGETVIGMNNNIKQKYIRDIQIGDEIKITWSLPNVFSNGVHTLNLDVTYNGGTSVSDRWENAIQFRVNKVEKTPYKVSPRVELELAALKEKVN